MNNPEKSRETDALLNAVLADCEWEAVRSSLKREGVAAMVVASRRRVRVRSALTACAALLLATTAGWLSSLVRWQTAPVASQPGLPPASEQRFVSEAEMLAMFPSHSCVIAEVDGERRLVFFDASKAEE